MADSSSSLTPEKRLLHLIESGGKGEAAPSGAGATAVRETVPSSFTGPSFQDRLTDMPRRIGLFFSDFRLRFGLGTVNKTARIILVGLAFVTLANALYEMKVSGRDPLLGLDAPARKLATLDEDETAFDVSKIQGADSRNVFMPFAKRDELQAAKPGSQSGDRLVEMTKTMKLTGISFNPEDEKATYCMIEDLQKNITVFLRVGDRISGMKVGKILEESVELEYENEKIEIR